MSERKILLFLIPAGWLLIYGMVAYMGKKNLQNMGNPFSSDLFGCIFTILAVELAIIGVFAIMLLAGTPFGTSRIEKELVKIGFTDEMGKAPLLLSRRKNGKGVEFEFFSKRIPISEYEKRINEIETVLNIKIMSIENLHDMQHVIINAVPGGTIKDRNEIIPWENGMLSNKDFELVLGESFRGTECIDIAITPHILIGGGSGSGKTNLLKLVLMECIQKKAVVYLADFKGGVDYPPMWHTYCSIITYSGQMNALLDSILSCMEERRDMLVEARVSNIGDYNERNCEPLPRIIIACDEIAEVLDKTGLSKEEKNLISQIESKLSTIARQGRAFGIHLILATQRPDADILKGQIKINLGYRICGRADSILSKIILDNPDASEKISQDDQGMFLTNTGILFRGYYCDENCLAEYESNG